MRIGDILMKSVRFQKNFNKKLILFSCLTILWIVVIFFFSLQSGDESSQLSGGIVAWVVSLICPEDFAHTEILEMLIRKAAHFTEYFILGVLMSLTIRQTKCTRYILMPWFLGTVVACCDETIQLFSDGRAGRIFDVMLDSSGVLTGCLILFLLLLAKSKR